MKTTLRFFISSSFMIFLLTCASRSAYAVSEFAFPLPTGKHLLTTDYHLHDEYLKFPQFSLDFQAAEIPKGTSTDVSEARCYTYGMPILSAREGVVEEIKSDDRRHVGDSYGSYVSVRHADKSLALYGHMIFQSNTAYVNPGDHVRQGQILGLMGDTGNIHSEFENSPCDQDGNYGTHLHFEIRNLKDGSGHLIPAEPLGDPADKNFRVGSTYPSETFAVDPNNVYVQKHAGKFPYVLQIEEVYSLSPLEVSTGTEVRFHLTGKYFHPGSLLTMPFCTTQSTTIEDAEHATISCRLKSGPWHGAFPNVNQDSGLLHYELGNGNLAKSSIQEVNYLTPKPGEFLNLTILGQHLNADIAIIVQDKETDGQIGSCDFKNQFSLLSPTKITARCRMPLNLGPVAAKVNRNFSITIYASDAAKRGREQPIYSSQFETSYGISGTEISPRKAVYYTPTRFTISGKNVQRTTIFYIEGCAKKDLKILSQQYDELVLECLIQPLPGTDLKSMKGKTFQHLFLFKTKSRQNDLGENVLNDQEDEENIVLSGYINMSYDDEVRIDSLEPKEAIVGKETTFTVKGNRLPYTDESRDIPLLSMLHCPGTGVNKEIDILPHSYTPYGFSFVCTPEFSTHLGPKKQDPFDLNHLDCDRINAHQWTEDQKSKALEKCYETDDREIKKAMWKRFDEFFSKLAPRVLEVRKQVGEKTPLLAKEETRVISALYDFIKREEKFQFQFKRQDREYKSTGEPVVTSITIGTITTTNRQQPISVIGTSLPRDLILKSDDCGQIAITFGSSERYDAVCLLKKVPLEEIVVIQESKMKELFRKSIDVVEVYQVETGRNATNDHLILINVTGVNLKSTVKTESPQCDQFQFQREASSTQLFMSCEVHAGIFSQPKALQLKIFTGDNVLLFENTIAIQDDFVSNAIPIENQQRAQVSESKPTFQVANSDFFGLKCAIGNDQNFFLGDCSLSSPFFGKANVQAFYNRILDQAVVDGAVTRKESHKDDTLSLAGVRFTPFNGQALVAADIPDKSLMVSGEVSGVGVDAEEAVGFPLSFKLADYEGSILLHAPSFELNKSREQSRIILGLGKLEGQQMDKLWDLVTGATSIIAELLLKKDPSQAPAGQSLVAALSKAKEKAKTFIPTISFFKVIDLIPETLAFYDNFDFTARGKLKFDPFSKSVALVKVGNPVYADLGTFDLDLHAHEGILKMAGTAINTLKILNNDILRTDKSLIEAGLTIQLKKDHGTIDLDPVEVHLPGDLATAKADAHISHLFDLANLFTWGNLRAGVQVMGLELAEAGAKFRFDPNGSYRVSDETGEGIFQLAAQLKLLVLLAKGNAILTFLNHQLVMDLGGDLELVFLNSNKKILDALSRSRFGNGQVTTCVNSSSGEITFYNPLVHHDTTFKGGLSFEANVDTTGFFGMSPKIVAISGQWEKGNRTGLKYDGTKNLLSAFSEYNQPCTDAPGDEFLKSIVADEPDQKTTSQGSFFDMLIPRALAAEEEKPSILNASWDLTGWKSISVDPQNGNDVGIFDAAGQPVPLSVDVPGIWDVPGPHAIIITDAAAFAATGYHIEIIRNNDLPTSVETRTVVGNQSTIDHYAVTELKTSGNAVDLAGISPGKQLTIDRAALAPSETRTETFTADDLRIVADVKSDPLPQPPQNPQISSSFPDIRSASLSQAVEFLVSKGIINGYPDGMFKPEKTINRAEALKIIFIARGISTDSSALVSFPDVPSGEWYFPFVGAARSLGIISGYPDGTFHPNQEMNRAEFVKIAMLAQPTYSPTPSHASVRNQYSDLDPEQWYMPMLSYAFDHHYLENSMKFKPTAGMTRGDAALMIYKTLTR